MDFNLFFYRLTHCPEVHWNMGGIGNQAAMLIKNSTGEIQPFFNICGNGCLLQSSPHLFANGHEEIAEYGELYGIHCGCKFTLRVLVYFYDNIAMSVPSVPIPGFHKDGGAILDNYGRAANSFFRWQVIEEVDGCGKWASMKVAVAYRDRRCGVVITALQKRSWQ